MVLTKHELPDAVKVSGNFYRIHTEHYYWFQFAELLENKDTKYSDFNHFYIGEKPEDIAEGFKQLLAFFYEQKEVPRTDGETDNTRILDYKIDADLIYSAILECFGIDIIETPVHWHKLRAMLNGIHNTRLNDIMSYRAYKGKDKELLRLKTIWAIPVKDDYSDKDLEEFNKEFI